MAEILIVDDDPNVREVVEMYLRREGHGIVSAADGPEALRLYRLNRPDLVLLDLGLPGLDGLEVARRIRAVDDVPLVMLTGRAEEEHRSAGLDAGADEYVVKPFSPPALTDLVEEILRREDGTPGEAQGAQVTNAGVIEAGGLRIDPRARRVTVRGAPAGLAALEFDLLYRLASRPGRTFTRDELMNEVWGQTLTADPTEVGTHVHRLRQKLEDDPERPRYLLTVWGAGYRFEGGCSHGE